MTEAEFQLDLEHFDYCLRNIYKTKQSVSEFLAIDIFKEELYSMCMDKISSGEDVELFSSLLWKLKNFSKNDLGKEKAKEYPIEQLVNDCGYDMNRAGFINCFVHEDRTASMKIYKNTNSYFCHACRVGGDCIDFLMKSSGCDFITAVKRLT